MPTLLQKIKNRTPFRDMSPDDRKVLFICIGIAFVFWILVKLSKDYTVHRHASIEYELPLGKIFVTPPPEEVEVLLDAKGWYFFLNSIGGNKLSLHYHVSSHSFFELSAIELEGDINKLLVGKNVRIAQLYFNGVRIKLEEQSIKRLPIRLVNQIAYAPEYSISEAIQLTPDTVTVSGTIDELKGLTEWPTDTLKLNKLDQDYAGKISLQSSETGLLFSTTKTTVNIKVERFTEKNLLVSIQKDSIINDSIRFFPDKVLLKCIIGLGHYNELEASDFVIKAALNESILNEGKSTVAIELIQQPDFVRKIQFTPKVVEFFIIK